MACSRLSSAFTKPLPYLSEAQLSLNCLVSTVWSRTDHLVIILLTENTSIVTQPHLASGCSASTSNARSKCKPEISNHILFNFFSKIRHVSCATRQQCQNQCSNMMHEEDTYDNNLIDMETSNHIHPGAQMHTAENAVNSISWRMLI